MHRNFTTHSVIQRVAVLTALFNNALLIFLIFRKSASKLGNYKYLMVYIAVFEMIYAILDGLTVPEIYSKDCANLMVVRADHAILPIEVLPVFSVMFCNMFGMSMSLFAIHFIYRYLVVSRNRFLKKHDGKFIVFVLLLTVIFGILWSFVTWFTMAPFPKADEYLRNHYIGPRNLEMDQIAYIGFYYYPKDENGVEFVHWKSIYGISIQCVFISVSFFLIFFYGFKCYHQTRFLVQQSSQSSSFENLQSQLFYALVFQTLIPVFLMHLPASVVYMAALFNSSTEIFGEFVSVTICLYPALDPLPNFFIIKTYRNAIFDFFKCLLRKVTCRRSLSAVNPGNVSSRTLKVSNVSRMSTVQLS